MSACRLSIVEGGFPASVVASSSRFERIQGEGRRAGRPLSCSRAGRPFVTLIGRDHEVPCSLRVVGVGEFHASNKAVVRGAEKPEEHRRYRSVRW